MNVFRSTTTKRNLFFLFAAVCITTFFISSCATTHSPEEGTLTASWYGEPFHGRKTASGEVYNMHGLSAAHKTAALGTILDVKSLKNGRKVRVTINDRGPFIKGRDLDLSYGAAKKLDMIDDGVIKVVARKVGYDSRYAKYIKDGSAIQKSEISTQSDDPVYFTAQVGAFTNKRNAETLAKKLNNIAEDVNVSSAYVNGKNFYRVHVGKYKSREKANDIMEYLNARGYEAKVNKI